jgi:hypothetical protein
MKLLDYEPSDKKDGLEYFKSKGYLLVDATYKQVNELKGKNRDETILSDYDYLVSDLEKFALIRISPYSLLKLMCANCMMKSYRQRVSISSTKVFQFHFHHMGSRNGFIL